MTQTNQMKNKSRNDFYSAIVKGVGNKGVYSRTLKKDGDIQPSDVEQWATANGYACKVDGQTVTVARIMP